MQIWRDAWRIAADFPLAGTGPGGFYGVYFPYATPPTTTVPVHVHNDWLQVWVETGGVGFFLFASACACLFAFGLGRWRRLDEASSERPLFAGALGAMAGIGAQSLADFSLRMPLNALVLAAVVGLLMGSDASPPRRRTRERPDPPRR
jgi:O-antigen ligase